MIRGVKVSPLEGVGSMLRWVEGDVLRRIQALAQQAADETFEFLRSYTGEVQPSWAGSGPRPAHPGHWADRTFLLMNSYVMRLDQQPRVVVLTIGIAAPAAEYAEQLEGRRGATGKQYWVLGGALEKGGIFEESVVKAAMAYGFEARAG